MKYSTLVVRVLRDQRSLLAGRWGKAGRNIQKSADTLDIVTDADLEVEDRIASALRNFCPEIDFVGEEAGGARESERFWLCDPIDGTLQYAKGERGCTSQIALIERGIVTFSAIYDFLDDVMYWAERGRGAYRDDSPLSVSAQRNLAGARIFWEMDIRIAKNKELMNRLVCGGVQLVKWETAGWELTRVANGEFDARICVDPFGKDYDFAPGSLLVTEAGGTVANIGKITFDYKNINSIASNNSLFSVLSQELNAAHVV